MAREKQFQESAEELSQTLKYAKEVKLDVCECIKCILCISFRTAWLVLI